MFTNTDEVFAAFKAGSIDAATCQAELARLNKVPFSCDVGPKGWLMLKFDGHKFPANMSYEAAQECFSAEGAAKVREFLAANKSRFKVRAA